MPCRERRKALRKMGAGLEVAERADFGFAARHLDFRDHAPGCLRSLSKVRANFSLSWTMKAPGHQAGGFTACLFPNHLEPVGVAQSGPLVLEVSFMAISFFAFM